MRRRQAARAWLPWCSSASTKPSCMHAVRATRPRPGCAAATRSRPPQRALGRRAPCARALWSVWRAGGQAGSGLPAAAVWRAGGQAGRRGAGSDLRMHTFEKDMSMSSTMALVLL